MTSIGQTWWAVLQDRELSLEAETRNGLVAVRLLEQHTAQELEAADGRLDIIAAGAFSLDNGTVPEDQIIRDLISDSLKNNHGASAYQYVRPDGERWVSTSDFPSYIIPAEKRDYIDYLLKHPEQKKILLSRPLQRFVDSEIVLPIARNLYDHSGKYLGLISTEVSILNFSSPYSNVAKNNNAVVELLADAGYVLVRTPYDPQAASRSLVGSPLLLAAKNGPIEGAMMDFKVPGQPGSQMVVYRKTARFPVTTIFRRDMDDVLSAWKRRTWDRVLFSVMFIVFQLMLSFFLLSQIRGLHQSQMALQSSKRSLRESEAKFVDLFQRSPVPLAMIDIDTDQMIEVNNAILAQFGYKREEFLGRTPAELNLWVSYADRAPYLLRLAKEHFVERYEAKFRHKDGTRMVCQLSSRVIETAGQNVIIFSPMDVTHLREVEQEIRDLNIDLEQRVAQRTVKLEAALMSVKNMQADLERLALTDELTGMPNRRHFLHQLDQELNRSSRYHRPLCLAMLDLDHFKQVNDRFGHSGGDEVLKHFTAFLRAHLRSGDMVGRLGGEEFAVMLPETRVDDALFVLRRIETLLMAECLDHIAPGFGYTFSGGVAALPDYETIESVVLLARADSALYEAKSNGRKQVLPYKDPVPD